MTLQIDDRNRVRTITLDRPEALNAFNEALYDATAEALLAAAEDPAVAVVLLTGNGRGVQRRHRPAGDARARDRPDFVPGKHGFLGLLDALVAFPKPLVCAVNGVGPRHRRTILGFADLAFMSTDGPAQVPVHQPRRRARGGVVVPASRAGRPAERRLDAAVRRSGSPRRRRRRWAWSGGSASPTTCSPEARRHAEVLAARPISSLVAVKRTMTEPLRAEIDAARERENAAFAELMGGPANLEALAAFAEGREPDFTGF